MKKLIAWFMSIGNRLFSFTKSTVARAYDEFGDDALEIVEQVKIAYGASKTGAEKFNIAKEMLKAAKPKLTTVANWLLDTVVQMAYGEYMSKQALIDTDKDGVPDYMDICKEIGAPPGGCVTKDGCPDSDCDGIADSK